MTGKQENLSHEEVWDDSALIDSWNEALEEYKACTLTIKESSPEPRDDAEATEPTSAPTSAPEAILNEKTPSSSRNESQAAPQGLPTFPVQTVLGSVQDENLKKLLMSWYYAGYYTGLFKGQQQAQQNRES
ncbi:Survival motor neuron 1 [Fusarium albosuccineum]|uniref:Survival motor neuron 1 n=1 Tax=Fusarium albosuccineum TaxID=1237068 RepID=A0A8H4PL38_9HYPO|nr:Survival motor neuron 1 [Fusarium albosuccineum]